jgi:DNA helicase-2/ATP-dependent DNA helicase PcrA
VPQSIVSEELQLLERVLRVLAQEGSPSGPSEEPIVRELEHIRELLVSGQESKDRTALLDQWQRGTALLAQLRRSRRGPRLERSSPYFAHLRLREGERERDLCLGKATCVRDGVRVVDWRNAPVSRVFYRYQQGELYEEEFGGRLVQGEVLARRTVTIVASRLQRVEAPEGSFQRDPEDPERWVEREGSRLQGGEGAAVRAHRIGSPQGRRLGTDPSGAQHRTDKRLPDIAGLLDPAQFELISRNAPGLLVVRGSAGSGKTTVALHRIAYLAYQDRRIDSPRTLFLTFSPALRNYVAHVLPALGVTRVQLRTFEEWASAQRGRVLPRLPRTHRDDTPAVVRRAKLHAAVAEALEAQVARAPAPRRWQQVVDDWASTLTDATLLEECFGRHPGARMGPESLAALLDWSRRRVDEVFAWLEGDREAGVGLDPEDDALLLRAWQLRMGPLVADGRPLAYRHLAIDEVQDLSPTELRVLLDCAEEPRSVTLAGDTQQQVASDAGFRSWDDLFDTLGRDDLRTTTLEVSYRSSPEIMRFARGVLGPLQEDEEPTHAARPGPPVELFEFSDPGACLVFLADALGRLAIDEPLASIAVLTPSPAVSSLYHEGLERSDVPRLRRVVGYDFSFAPGVEVAEIEHAKGLEFDYVVLVDVSATSFPRDPRWRRLLHVGATRAIHQLWVMSSSPPSPRVKGLTPAR